MRKGLFLLSAALLFAGTANADTIGIGTTKGGFTNQAGQSLSKVVSQNTDLQMRSQPFAGSSVYVPATNDGQIEFALVNELESLHAVTGTGTYKDLGRKLPNLRVVTATIPFRVALYVRADSNIRTVADLKGKRVPAGWTTHKIIQPLMDAVLAAAGLTYDDVIKVPVTNVVKSANLFAAGKADAFFFVFGAGKVRETNAKVSGGIRVLPFDDSAAMLKAAQKYVPMAYGHSVKVSKRNVGVDKAMKVMAYWHTVAANKDVPDDVVYKVAKVMYEHRADLVKAFGGWGLFKTDKMAQTFKGLTYHPGAIKLYKEIGQWPPK